jgi:4-amino-4-deoxy-L-arabinose transferase-like glycosyltransferase
MATWLKDNKEILLIISFFALLSALFYSPNLWWDPAVFIGMGKYAWSLGNVGLWEPARPVGLPIIIGALWKMGLNPVLFGTVFNIVISMILVYVFYLLIKEITNKKTSLLFSAIFILNYTFVFYSSIFLTDMISALFSLTAVYLTLKKEKIFLPGALIGLAAVTRFTHLIFIPVLLIGIFARKKMVMKNSLTFLAGVMLVILPFMATNLFLYGNPILPFIEGQKLIGMVAMNYLESTDFWFYIYNLVIWMPVVVLFALLSLRSKIDWKYLVLAAAFALPLIYHSLLSYRTMRYALMFLPFLYIIAGMGYHQIFKNKKSPKYLLLGLLVLQIIISAAALCHGYAGVQREVPQEINEFENYISSVSVRGEIWSSTPDISAKYDVKTAELIYYPVFDSNKIKELEDKMDNADVQLIFIKSCDIPCIKYDAECEKNREEFMDRLAENFEVVFNQKSGNCTLQIFEWKNR